MNNKFCWICSKKLYGGLKYKITDEEGIDHIVHRACGEGEGYKTESLQKERRYKNG